MKRDSMRNTKGQNVHPAIRVGIGTPERVQRSGERVVLVQGMGGILTGHTYHGVHKLTASTSYSATIPLELTHSPRYSTLKLLSPSAPGGQSPLSPPIASRPSLLT